MKIIGICAARNEQDVIEAFVRHTLSVCDRLLVIDHGSTDETPAILKSLQEEGMPLEVFRDDTIGLLQTAHMHRLSQIAANEHQADWIFCLDSDEFIQGDVRRVLAEHDAAGGPGYIQYWLVNYVVRPEDDPGEINPVKRIRHRTVDHAASETDRRTCKSIVSGKVARQEGFFIAHGSHKVFICGEEPPFAITRELWLGHFSLRSPCQYGGKVVSILLQRNGQRSKLVDNYDFYEADYRRLHESYTGFANDFSTIPVSWWTRTITGIECCPIDYRGGTLRYTSTVSDVDQFIRNTLDWGFRMAEATATSQTEQGEEAKETSYIALRDGEGIVQQQELAANTSTFLKFRFSLAELKKACPLILRIACGPGVIEVERVQLQFTDGPPREFRGSDLMELLTVAQNGLAARAGAIQRFFSSIPPVNLNVWVETHQATGMEIHLRFLNRHQAMSLAIGNLGGIHWIAKQLRKQERDPAPIETPLNTAFTLSPLEPSLIAIGEGWGPLQFSGIKLLEQRGQLGVRFAEPLRGKLRLRFKIATKFNGKPSASGSAIRVSAEGAPAVTRQAEDRGQWIDIDLPAAPAGRRGVDLVFEAGDACIEFRVKEAMVQALHEGGWLPRILKRTLHFYERKIASPVKPKQLTPGEVIQFGKGGKGLELATSGWAPPEASGSRCEAALALLRFFLPSTPGSKIKLLLVGGSGSGIVRLAWRNKDLTSWWLDAHTPQWVEIPLPPEATRLGETLLLFRSTEASIGFELREMVLSVG